MNEIEEETLEPIIDQCREALHAISMIEDDMASNDNEFFMGVKVGKAIVLLEAVVHELERRENAKAIEEDEDQ